MNRKWLLFIIIGLALILAAPSLIGCTSNNPIKTGVLKGKVSIGPRPPGEIEKAYPPEVYQPRKVMVYDADHVKLIKQVDLDEKGYYRVELPPSDYTIDINYYGNDASSTVPRKLKIESDLHYNLDIDFNTGVPIIK
jgi:hypothetical protein